MAKTKFSIIVPTFNRYNNGLLAEAIKSVQDQKRGDFGYEVVVVDDATLGGIPADFVKKYDKNIKFYSLPQNGGTPKAIQKGIKEATGDYIVILGDDDLLPEASLLKRTDFIKKNPDLDWFYAKTQLLNEKGKPIKTYSQSEEFKDHHYARMFLYNYIQGGTTTVKKKVYDSIKWPNWLTTRDDDFIAFELVRPGKYKFAFLDEVVYGYRAHTIGERESAANLRTNRIDAIDRRIRYELHDPELAFLADVAKKAAVAEAELKEREERLNTIYSSFFWKATGPFRKIRKFLRK